MSASRKNWHPNRDNKMQAALDQTDGIPEKLRKIAKSQDRRKYPWISSSDIHTLPSAFPLHHYFDTISIRYKTAALIFLQTNYSKHIQSLPPLTQREDRADYSEDPPSTPDQ